MEETFGDRKLMASKLSGEDLPDLGIQTTALRKVGFLNMRGSLPQVFLSENSDKPPPLHRTFRGGAEYCAGV